jgi:hypothetical protein
VRVFRRVGGPVRGQIKSREAQRKTMRAETADWLAPLMVEADGCDIDVMLLIQASEMPAAEAGSPQIDALVELLPDGAKVMAVDWVRFGQLLRHELGLDQTYSDPTKH